MWKIQGIFFRPYRPAFLSACHDPFLVSGLSLPCLCCPVCCCWSMPVWLLYESCIRIPLCLLNHYNTCLGWWTQLPIYCRQQKRRKKRENLDLFTAQISPHVHIYQNCILLYTLLQRCIMLSHNNSLICCSDFKTF